MYLGKIPINLKKSYPIKIGKLPFSSNFLIPQIVGSQVKINPLIVILGVVLGEMMWGIPGMFLSVPYIAVGKVIFDRVDSLNAWGILLGDEETDDKKEKSLSKRMEEVKEKEEE